MYSKKNVLELLDGIVDFTSRQFAYYVKLEIVTPDVVDSKGRGAVKYFSPENLIDFALARTLEGRGLRLKEIKAILDETRKPIIRREYKRKVKAYDIHLIIGDPNTDDFEVYTVMTLPKNRLAENVGKPESEISDDAWQLKLDPDKHDSYITENLSKIISKVLKRL